MKEYTLRDIISNGGMQYRHLYNITAISCDVADHVLECPSSLKKLAEKMPSATVVVYGDETLGVWQDGQPWAVEFPSPDRRGKRLPDPVWHYIRMAMGDDGDTRAV